MIRCATSMSLHNAPRYFSSHNYLLLYQVEKDGGKKLLQGPTIVSNIPLYEHLKNIKNNSEIRITINVQTQSPIGI